jgi:ABC-2 type transport system ATP-binding protein
VRRLRLLDDPGSVDSIMERLSLARYRDRQVCHLSLGNAQRLGLAKALMHDPELLILDEPANGLDPVGIVEIRELLKELAAARGVTIFISSHILGEISKFADRIGIIHEGRLLQEVDSDELLGLGKRRLLVKTRDNQAAAAVLERAGHAVSLVPEKAALSVTNDEALGGPDGVATLLVQAGCAPTMLALEEEDLEAHFLRVIGAERGGAR